MATDNSSGDFTYPYYPPQPGWRWDYRPCFGYPGPWQCPFCKTVYSPHVDKCTCQSSNPWTTPTVWNNIDETA